jgi:hypothetical protein
METVAVVHSNDVGVFVRDGLYISSVEGPRDQSRTVTFPDGTRTMRATTHQQENCTLWVTTGGRVYCQGYRRPGNPTRRLRSYNQDTLHDLFGSLILPRDFWGLRT